MYPLTLEHVSKRYGHETVVDDLSFTVQPGRVTGFFGPNGAGKSTTMKILLDLAAADHGRVCIGDRRYRDLTDPARTVGVMIEPDAFHPGRSGRNHLRVLADASGVPASRVDELLTMVELTKAADRRVGGYSLGMRQRLGLAAALLGDPPILVLDEPGNGLDPHGIRWLRGLLRERAARGHTVFVSSHLLDEAEHMVDDVVVIDRGKLVAAGPLESFQSSAVSVRTDDPGRLRTVVTDAGATTELRDDGELVVRGLTATDVGNLAFAARVRVHGLTPSAGSLEDLFLDWTRETRVRAVDLPTHKEVRPV